MVSVISTTQTLIPLEVFPAHTTIDYPKDGFPLNDYIIPRNLT